MNTPSQQRAVANFRRFLEQGRNTNAAYGDTITVFEEVPAGRGEFWIRAETEMVGLPQGNYLRAVSHDYWFVLVGRKGALIVKQAPSSFRQFHGRRAFNMNFDVA